MLVSSVQQNDCYIYSYIIYNRHAYIFLYMYAHTYIFQLYIFNYNSVIYSYIIWMYNIYAYICIYILIYACIYVFFFQILFHYRVEFPVLYSKSLQFICLIYNSVYAFSSNSISPLIPPYHYPFSNYKFVFYVYESISIFLIQWNFILKSVPTGLGQDRGISRLDETGLCLSFVLTSLWVWAPCASSPRFSVLLRSVFLSPFTW